MQLGLCSGHDTPLNLENQCNTKNKSNILECSIIRVGDIDCDFIYDFSATGFSAKGERKLDSKCEQICTISVCLRFPIFLHNYTKTLCAVEKLAAGGGSLQAAHFRLARESISACVLGLSGDRCREKADTDTRPPGLSLVLHSPSVTKVTRV